MTGVLIYTEADEIVPLGLQLNQKIHIIFQASVVVWKEFFLLLKNFFSLF